MTVLRANAGGRQGVRTREDITEALREYAARYGQPTTASFNPSTAKWRDDALAVERYYAGRLDGRPWPSLNCIKDHFGGRFNDALEAAGLPRNRPGPQSGRPAGLHRPNREVREHRVHVPDERLIAAAARVRRAEDRAATALARADRLAAEVRELRAHPVERIVSVPSRAEPRVIEKTKTVRVRDERALERERSRTAAAPGGAGSHHLEVEGRRAPGCCRGARRRGRRV